MPNTTSKIVSTFRRRSLVIGQLKVVSRFWPVGLLWLGGTSVCSLISVTGFALVAWAAPEVRWDDASDLAAAQQMQQAGKDSEALIALQQLRTKSPKYSVENDVDYLIMVSALRVGNYQLTWDASQTWRVVQPAALFENQVESKVEAGSTWATRRELAAQVFLAQIQAAYQLALGAMDLKTQQQWLNQAEVACRELKNLQPRADYLEPLDYHTNLIALQQELRRSTEEVNTDDSAKRLTRLQQLSGEFIAAADRATGAEWKQKNRYYAAVTAEMAGDLPAAMKLWDDLQKDVTVAAEIRRSSLLALAESYLNRWFAANSQSLASESEKETRQQWLVESRDRYQQLQREYSDFDSARVAFNLGTCYRLLDDHSRAIEQFQKITWPAQPDTDLGNAYLAWQAQFNQARSHFALEQFEQARQIVDSALPQLKYAVDSAAGQAILLRMRIAQQAADWAMIADLRQKGDAWLRLIPEHGSEIDFLVALAQFQSTEPSTKSEGAKLLAAIAGQTNQPWSNLAKLQLLPWQVEPDAARHSSSRISFDQATPDLKERLQAAVSSADDLLNSSLLQADDFPVNPALLLPQQAKVLEQRRQVRQWQANALFRLGEHASAAVKFGDLLKDYANDSAAPEWSMKRAVGLAKSTSPAMALDQLTEGLVQTWPPAIQAEGWLVRGELFRLQNNERAAAQAYEKWLGLAVDPSDKVTAMESALGAYHRLPSPTDTVRLINQWEREFSGSTLMSLLLQRGIAQYSLKEFAKAEADFATLLSLASTTTPVDDAQRNFIAELVADAQVNQGLALREQGKNPEAKRLWESFLSDHSQHEYREQVTQWIQAIDPQWQAPIAGGEVAETSGTDKMSLDQRFERAHQAFEQQQWAQAAAAFQTLADDAKADARHDQILYFLGWSLREQSKFTEAQAAWEKMLSLHLNSPWVARCQFHLGEADYRDGNYVRAAERFQLAKTTATEAPLRRSALYMEAWSDLQRKEYELAQKKFQSIVDQATSEERELPLVLEAVALVGQCELQAGKMTEALQTFQTAAATIEKLQTQKPEMYFQVCFNAGRAAIEVDRAQEALPWLAKCVTSIDSGLLPATIDEMLQAEAKFLLGVARRMTNDLDGATTVLTSLSSRADTVGLRSLMQLALIARTRGDERAAQRNYTAVANGAYGEQLSAQAIEWKAQSQLEMGLSLLRSANLQTDAAVRAEHVRQAKTWLTRAQLQNDSTTVSQQATEQLNQLKQLGR